MSRDADATDPGSRDRQPETGAPSIEAATSADAPTIRDLLADLAHTLGAPGKFHATVDDIRRYGFGSAPQFEVLLAKVDGTPVGLVLYFFTFSSWRGRPGVYVQDLHVLARHRGGGIGRRLLAAAAARGRAAGCTHLRLSVDADNAAGRGFYDGLGFRHRHDETIHEIAGAEFDRLGRD